MKAQQSGFTLIELIMVIVILGILSAVAIPKFINLQTDASKAATHGVAGAISSAFAINLAGQMAGTKGVAITSTAGIAATAAINSVMNSALSTDYGILPSGANAIVCGAVGSTIGLTVYPVAATLSTNTYAATLLCTG